MRRIIVIVIMMIVVSSASSKASAQGEEVEQLLLDVEKLAQLKQILSDVKKGYQVISTGYTTIKNISEGNFDLHKAFLDGLLRVSPAVRNYKKVAAIIQDQLQMVNEYKNAFNRFKKDKHFTPEEINYLGSVYSNLFHESLKNLDALTTVLTANKFRMSDEERLKAIDSLYSDMQDKLTFLRQFNNNTTILAIQRARERKDAASLKEIYGIIY